jgi:hypothetical protein
MKLNNKLKIYYVTAIVGVVLSVTVFIYNAWRLEASENNNNVRTASFEVLKELAELEQIIYALHYDANHVEGSPRKGWVRVGLIFDLSMLIGEQPKIQAGELISAWTDNWNRIETDMTATSTVVNKIDEMRSTIKQTLISLE